MEDKQGMQFFSYIRDQVLALLREEEGQDGIEYLLVIGGVTTALIIAIAAAVAGAPFTTVVTQACTEAVQVLDAAASC